MPGRRHYDPIGRRYDPRGRRYDPRGRRYDPRGRPYDLMDDSMIQRHEFLRDDALNAAFLNF
jgi:hypothetical protein